MHGNFFESARADAKAGYDNTRCYARRIRPTASQFLDKPRDASVIVARSCNREFAAMSLYISKTVQDRAIVTIES